jgi:hypothetical protein
VTPRAAQGIRKLYELAGYQVRSKVGGDGLLTVAAMKDDEKDPVSA